MNRQLGFQNQTHRLPGQALYKSFQPAVFAASLCTFSAGYRLFIRWWLDPFPFRE
jgi:hypothetical protein